MLEDVRKFLSEGVALQLSGVLIHQGRAEAVARAGQQCLKVLVLSQGVRLALQAGQRCVCGSKT